MAVYDGVPSIRLEGDERRALALIPEAKVVLQQAQAVAKNADISTFSMSRRVSDDEYIYVLIAGGQNIIQISAGVTVVDTVVEEAPPGVEARSMPTLYSGIVLNGVFEERTRTGANGEEIKYNVVKEWAPTPTCARISKLATGRQPSARLAVQPGAGFDELKSAPGSAYTYSQYVLLRSSMYSGLMAKVVQVVMGLGRLPKSMAYNKDSAEKGVQIQYDYKFNRTHGITRAADGRLWLVEIGIGRGVLAMPLPMFESSTSESFRDRAADRGDNALVTVWDELGGLPTGQTFPSGSALTTAIEDGRVLRLVTAEEMGRFYACSGYSSACGWAFAPNGREAHNVGYRYSDDDVYQHGDWYQVSITIGATDPDWEPGKPLAVASGSLRLQSTGLLWSPPITRSYLPVKYHEPLLPGLLSHVAKPTAPGPTPSYNTAVFVAFINGELKVGRHFRPKPGGAYNVTETDISPGECLYEGSWTTTRYTGNREMPSMPITNDCDDRHLLQEGVVTTTLTSNSKGFDPPRFGDFITAPSFCFVVRNKVYEDTVVSETKNGEYIGATLIVPGFTREGYYYVQGNGFGSHYGSTTVTYKLLGDPNGAYGYRSFVGGSAPPWGDTPGCRTDNCGGKHKERRVMCLTHDVGACSEFADSGPFIGVCDNIEAACAGTPQTRVPYSTSWNKGGDFTGKVTAYLNHQNGPFTGEVTKGTYEYWQLASPDFETGLIQTLFASYSSIGEDSAIFPTLDASNPLRTDGYFPVPITDDDGHPTFIGVNQP